MRTRNFSFPIFLLLFVSSSPLTLAQGVAQEGMLEGSTASGFQMIVHPDNPIHEIAREVVASYYLLGEQTWEDGTPVQPAAQMPGIAARDAFRAAIHRDSAASVAQVWEKAPVQGLSRLPAFHNDKAVIEWVRKRPGGIGYISAQTQAPNGVKVVALVGDEDEGEIDEEVPERLSLVLDASGSMRSRIDGEPKIEIARRTLGSFLENFEEEVEFGLTAFGHRSPGCDDIEVLIPLGPSDPAVVKAALGQLQARGSTPLTQAIRKAAQELQGTDKEDVQIVVVSDGEESCGQDPCDLADELAAAGIPITTYVVGFDVLRNAKAQEQLRCLAQKSGGTFELAWDARSLRKALKAALDKALGKAPEPTTVVVEPVEVAETPLYLDFEEVLVPAGSFNAVHSSSPQIEHFRTRTIHGNTWITDTEITQEDWRLLMGSEPSYFAGCDDCPVESINWYEAISFANRLSDLKEYSRCYELSGCQGAVGSGCPGGSQSCNGDFRCATVKRNAGCTGYQLPSALIWEYAARAGSETGYWNREEDLTFTDANCTASDQKSPEKTVHVREYTANPFGLYQVHGNVWEWMTEAQEAEIDLATLSSQSRARLRQLSRKRGGGTPKVFEAQIRGGSFADEPMHCRADHSVWQAPPIRSHRVGFRLIRTAEER